MVGIVHVHVETGVLLPVMISKAPVPFVHKKEGAVPPPQELSDVGAVAEIRTLPLTW
jgi:hypothetical protein